MTDPALDACAAERAIGAACLRMGEPTTTAWSADFLHALNEEHVTLCDERALRRLVDAAEATR